MSGSDRTGAIANQIIQWLGASNFEAEGPQDIDRLIETFDFRAEIDSSLSASANWEIIKDKLGLRTKGEFQELIRRFEAQERVRVRREIDDQFEEYGLETVTDAVIGREGVPPDLQERVDDVLDEFPPDVYDAILRDRVAELFEVLGQDLTVVDTQTLERLREETQTGPDAETRREVREQVLAELSQRFGQQFDSVDEAVRRLQERIEAARGERLRIAPVEIRRSGEDFLIRIPDGSQFDQFRQPARRRIERELDLNELGRTWTVVGEVRLRGGDLEAIDLETGRKKLGAVAEPQPLEAEQRDLGEQAEIETATASRLADRFVDIATESGSEGQGQEGES